MGKIKIGNTLRFLREDKNLKQDYVASRLGISKSSISKIENNKTNPSYEVLVKLADLYDVSLDRIFSRNWFAISEERKNNFIRISSKTKKFIENLLKEEYDDLLNYIENDPDQSIKLIKSRMKDYI